MKKHDKIDKEIIELHLKIIKLEKEELNHKLKVLEALLKEVEVKTPQLLQE